MLILHHYTTSLLLIGLIASNILESKSFSFVRKAKWGIECNHVKDSSNINKAAAVATAAFQGRFKMSSSADEENTPVEQPDDRIDVTQDPRLYRIKLPRAPGIEWGTDLSFSFVYVRNLEPGGPASLSNVVSKGDQICELRPISNGDDDDGEGLATVPLLGASFDVVMTSFASLSKKVKDVELVFFKGSKEELIDLCQGNEGKSSQNDDDTITITAIVNKGSSDEMTKIIKTKKGANLRQTLVDNDINVYQSFTRWTNCKGKQLCGTCIVDIKDGGVNTNRKSMDEASTLRENPDSYRLSCVTFAYGDVTVETFPPIEAAQWTR